MRMRAEMYEPLPGTRMRRRVYLMRHGDGSVQIEHEQHLEGLFARADWIRLLSEVGFQASVVALEHSEVEAGTCEMFVGKKAR